MSSPTPIRISRLTGKPVRKYVKNTFLNLQPIVEKPFSNVIEFKNMQRHNNCLESESYTFRSYRIKKNFTGNCQLCCFSNFASLIANSSNLTEQLKEIGNNIKPLIFVDIRQSFINQLKSKINNEAIISESNYISSNN